MLKLLYIIIVLTIISCSNQNDSISTTYSLIEEGDTPFGYKVYELENGMKVYLSQQKNSPRIQTNIGVKVGTKNDPVNATGLAHYLEQMMYNGTSEIGTDHWEKEKVILDEISDYYELKRQETNNQKVTLYNKVIDSLSIEASQYAIANEYDKLISEIGGQNTNSYTTLDQTVFTTNIPNSSLEKWAKIESERFSDLVLRLFTSKSKSIYEAYNMSQDSDDDRVFNALTKTLFPDHPYGTRTKSGRIEHLTNPSMESMHRFFEKYYVPNNMVVSLSGDFDYIQTIETIAKHFSKLKYKPLEKTALKSKKIRGKQVINLTGNETEEVIFLYKLRGLNGSNNVNYEIVNRMLFNGYSGLLDLNIIQSKKLQDSYSYLWSNYDYSMLIISGTPKEGQSLNEVEQLLKIEIDKLKNGEFYDWLPQACLNNIKKDIMLSVKTNQFRSTSLLDVGLNDKKTEVFLNRFLNKNNINKNEIVQAAKSLFNDEFVVLKKEQGAFENTYIKPPKTSLIKRRKNVHSKFYTSVVKMENINIEPKFEAYNSFLKQTVNDQFVYLKNSKNDLFSMDLVFDFGTNQYPYLELIADYAKTIGTQNKTNESVNIELFKLGGQWKIYANKESFTIKIEGLHQNFKAIVSEVVNLLKYPKHNAYTFKTFIKAKKKERADLGFNKDYLLWDAMLNFAEQQKMKSGYWSHQKLSALKENQLLLEISNLLQAKHTTFYHGPEERMRIEKIINELIPSNNSNNFMNFLKIEEKKSEKKVYFLDHNMVQSEILFVANKGMVNEKNTSFNKLFSYYYNALAEKEIRESKALAYSTYVSINESNIKGNNDFIYGYLGCQPDKLPFAISSFEQLLKQAPKDKILFEEAKSYVLKSLKDKNLIGESMFWEWKALKRKDFNLKTHEMTISELENISFQDFRVKFDSEVSKLDFTLLVLGDKTSINFEDLNHFGPVIKLNKNQILP
ncbi:MAG: insulinase family protein [Flavobacteriales bacterium]